MDAHVGQSSAGRTQHRHMKASRQSSRRCRSRAFPGRRSHSDVSCNHVFESNDELPQRRNVGPAIRNFPDSRGLQQRLFDYLDVMGRCLDVLLYPLNMDFNTGLPDGGRVSIISISGPRRGRKPIEGVQTADNERFCGRRQMHSDLCRILSRQRGGCNPCSRQPSSLSIGSATGP